MRLIDGDELLRRYDEEHEGPPGRARKLIEEAPEITLVEILSEKMHEIEQEELRRRWDE